jgi:hypothetical protein
MYKSYGSSANLAGTIYTNGETTITSGEPQIGFIYFSKRHNTIGLWYSYHAVC